jgi:hypothetical protein
MTIYNELTYDSFFSNAYYGRKPPKPDFLKEWVKPIPSSSPKTKLEICRRYLWTAMPLFTLNHYLGLAISTCSDIIVVAQSAEKVFHEQKLKIIAYHTFRGLLALTTAAAHFFDRSLSLSPLGRRISHAIKLTALTHDLVISMGRIGVLKIEKKSKIIKLCAHIANTIFCIIAVIFQTSKTNYWFLKIQCATEICFITRQIYKKKYVAAVIRISAAFLRYKLSSMECTDILIDPTETVKEELSDYEDFVDLDLGKEYLYFKRNGPKEKFLILCADFDDDKGLKAYDPREYTTIIHALSRRFDVKFRTIYKAEDIQKEIQIASQKGRVMGLWLQAHGAPFAIRLTNTLLLRSEDISPSLFSGLDPDCVIALQSCSTAKYPGTSFAYQVAKCSQRITYAADGIINICSLENVSPLEWSFNDRQQTVHTKKIVPEHSVV